MSDRVVVAVSGLYPAGFGCLLVGLRGNVRAVYADDAGVVEEWFFQRAPVDPGLWVWEGVYLADGEWRRPSAGELAEIQRT